MGDRVGLIFSGNGSQWPGMGADLLADPVFGAEVAAVDAELAPRLGWSVIAHLRSPAGRWRLERTEVAQPLLFAVQAGLVAMLRAHGVRPALMLGHSVGEVAAAYAAGSLTLREAAWVLAARGRAQAAVAGSGRMAAVRLSREQAEEAVARHPGVEIAAINSPQDVTVSGPAARLGALRDELRKRRVFFWMMDLDYAFHCAATEPVRPELEAELAGLAPAGPLDALVSTVNGGPATDLSGGLDGVHWWRNMRDPVLFAPAVDHALDRGITVLVEVGPQPALRPYLRRIIERRTSRPGDQRSVDVVATLRREVEGATVMNDAVASLIAAGAAVGG